MKEEILKYVNEINESKPYCIVLYKTKRRLNSLIEDKIVDSIYQSNQDFLDRGVDRAMNIPTEFGVSIDTWIYD
jgi:hypothetical protein